RGSDTLPGPDMLQTVDDDELARSQSLRHDPQAVDFGTEFHESILDVVVFGQRQDEFLGKIRTHGATLDEDTVAIFPSDESHTCKQARRVAAVRICQRSSRANRAGGGIDLVVDEIKLRRVRIAILVDESNVDV